VPFYLSDREISVGLFRRFMDDADIKAADKPANWKGPVQVRSPTDDCPVQHVKFRDTLLFCNWLSLKEGRRPCYRRISADQEVWECDFEANGYRLPREAEWEYAYRAGSTTMFPIGPEPDLLVEYGNIDLMKNLPGGSRLPNGWGFFDMSGNVWEDCWDASSEHPALVPRATTGPLKSGAPRAVRGGAFGGGSYYARSGFRYTTPPEDDAGEDGSRGFRVACSIPKEDAVRLTRRKPAVGLDVDDPLTAPRARWFREARYGLFIQWGIYAIPAGEYDGKTVPGPPQLIMRKAPIPKAEYEKFADRFDPKHFDANGGCAWPKRPACTTSCSPPSTTTAFVCLTAK
jgi:hypothetical protein